MQAIATLTIDGRSVNVKNGSRFTSYNAVLSSKPGHSLKILVVIEETRKGCALPNGSIIRFKSTCKISPTSLNKWHIAMDVRDSDVERLDQSTLTAHDMLFGCSFDISGVIHRRAHNAGKLLTLEIGSCVFIGATLNDFTLNNGQLLIGLPVAITAEFHSLSRTSDGTKVLIIFQPRKITLSDGTTAFHDVHKSHPPSSSHLRSPSSVHSQVSRHKLRRLLKLPENKSKRQSGEGQSTTIVTRSRSKKEQSQQQRKTRSSLASSIAVKPPCPKHRSLSPPTYEDMVKSLVKSIGTTGRRNRA